MELSEKILEFIANTVKKQRYHSINDIPEEFLKEYGKISKKEAEIANHVYNFNHFNY